MEATLIFILRTQEEIEEQELEIFLRRVLRNSWDFVPNL